MLQISQEDIKDEDATKAIREKRGTVANVLFDLDGTLAKHLPNYDELVIGPPIEPIVELAKDYHKRGYEVRIFTARAAPQKNLDGTDRDMTPVITKIQQWAELNLGFSVVVSNQKDYGTVAIYDDRAYRVEFNTGRVFQN